MNANFIAAGDATLSLARDEQSVRCSTDFILRRHHPTIGRRPAPRIGFLLNDRICTALTWNVFQTLGLVAPSFWLRRLRARLVGLCAMDHVPLEASVAVWETVGSARIGASVEAPKADVLIETEHAVFGFMTLFGSDLTTSSSAHPLGDAMLNLIDGVSIRAGVRDCYVGLITSDAADSPVASGLIDRYAASHEMLRRRLPSRRDGLVNLCDIGRLTWTEMAAILRDCAAASVLDDLERHAAARAVRWLEAVGITPAE